MPALVSDGCNYEADEVSIVKEQAREQVGMDRIKQVQSMARAFLVTHADGAIVYRAGREGLSRSVVPC